MLCVKINAAQSHTYTEFSFNLGLSTNHNLPHVAKHYCQGEAQGIPQDNFIKNIYIILNRKSKLCVLPCFV